MRETFLRRHFYDGRIRVWSMEHHKASSQNLTVWDYQRSTIKLLTYIRKAESCLRLWFLEFAIPLSRNPAGLRHRTCRTLIYLQLDGSLHVERNHYSASAARLPSVDSCSPRNTFPRSTCSPPNRMLNSYRSKAGKMCSRPSHVFLHPSLQSLRLMFDHDSLRLQCLY